MAKCKLPKRYLAGLFDGEGWISIRPQSSKRKLSSIHIQVGMGMTHKILKIIYKQFGGSLGIEEETKKHKKVYRWSLQSKQQIKNFLMLIYPYLIIKQKQAQIMLNFIDMKIVSGRQRTPCEVKVAKKYINKIRKLNGRVKRKDWFGDV